jgi:hypothetical protein
VCVCVYVSVCLRVLGSCEQASHRQVEPQEEGQEERQEGRGTSLHATVASIIVHHRVCLCSHMSYICVCVVALCTQEAYQVDSDAETEDGAVLVDGSGPVTPESTGAVTVLVDGSEPITVPQASMSSPGQELPSEQTQPVGVVEGQVIMSVPRQGLPSEQTHCVFTATAANMRTAASARPN